MSTYDRVIAMEVDPDHVFDFVSDPRNLPRILPTLHMAEQLEGDQIRVEGSADGRPFHVTGYFRADRHHRRLEWGSEGDHHYKGSLLVREGDTTELISEVLLELDFAGEPQGRGEAVLAHMEQALERIRDHFVKPL